MTSPFPFESMLIFSFLSGLLLLGVVLRAKVTFLQKFLFPGCLIGGMVGLIACHTRGVNIPSSSLETFAYHFFNISFISVGLTQDTESSGSAQKNQMLRGSTWMALVQGMTFPMQAIVGGLFVMGFGMIGLELFPTFGFLIPLGFNEGPGQALSIGKAWETVGFASGGTIGLTFSAIGYFFAFFVGVPFANYGIRKGWAVFGSKELSADFITGLLPKDSKNEIAGRLTMHPGNVETLAFQAALIGVVYGLTWAAIKGIGSLVPPDVATILWGFFFILGLGIAYMVKGLMKALNVVHLIDPGIQRRVTGMSIDYLIIATVSAIQLKVVWDYLLPIGLMSLATGIMTTLLVIYMGKKLDTFGLERSAAIFGTITGTVSCGLLLLRIIDPEFKTPVAFEIGLMNIFSLPIIGACTVLTNAPLWWGWSTGLTVAVFGGIFLISLGILKFMGFMNNPVSKA
jgi:ESS family glutamate:Na+ symporter